MKNRIIVFLKKRWLLIWVIICAVTITGISVMASYEGEDSIMKRVIVSSDGKSTGFTSNLLAGEISEGRYAHRSIYRTPRVSKIYEAEVYIRNHEPESPDFPYESDITYDLEVSITDSSGNIITDLTGFGGAEGKLVLILNEEGRTVATLPVGQTVSATIQNQTIVYEKGKPGSLKYILVYQNWDLDEDTEYCVKLKTTLARGQNNNYPDLADIGCVVGLKKNVDFEKNGWDAFLNESNDTITGTIDGYNLVLTGSGASDITIRWDSANISLNHLFRGTEPVFDLKSGEVEYVAPSGSETWATLIVHANANDAARDYRNYYNIQVYSTGNRRITASDFKKLTAEDSQPGTSLITVQIHDN